MEIAERIGIMSESIGQSDSVSWLKNLLIVIWLTVFLMRTITAQELV